MTAMPPSDDRRNQGRTRASLSAKCIINETEYRARIFEVSHLGMTLVCDPELPDAPTFQVMCRLKSSREFSFEVKTLNRQQVERGKLRVLRIGLAILNPSELMDDFLCELALQRLRDLKNEAAQLDEQTEESDHYGRGFQRLAFQLPAIARIEKKLYRCRTLDVSTRGLGLWVPPDFPHVSVFVLSYEVPEGMPIQLTAGVRNRRADTDGGWQLGLRVMSGNREFAAFLRKYDIWKAPED